MDEQAILEGLTLIIRKTLDDGKIVLDRTTTKFDVDGWDSVAHVRIMVAVEQEFGVVFDTDELSDIENIGELIDLVQAKSAA